MFEHVSIGAFLFSFSVFAFWMKSTPKIQPNHSEMFVRCVTTKQNQNENESKTAPKENENIDVWLVVWHSSCSAVTFTMQPILYRCNRAIEHSHEFHWCAYLILGSFFFDSIPFSSHFYSYFKFCFFALATYCSWHYSLSVVILEYISVSSLTISFLFFGNLFYIQCNINGFFLFLFLSQYEQKPGKNPLECMHFCS